jgi:hypothetical protein
VARSIDLEEEKNDEPAPEQQETIQKEMGRSDFASHGLSTARTGHTDGNDFGSCERLGRSIDF